MPSPHQVKSATVLVDGDEQESFYQELVKPIQGAVFYFVSDIREFWELHLTSDFSGLIVDEATLNELSEEDQFLYQDIEKVFAPLVVSVDQEDGAFKVEDSEISIEKIRSRIETQVLNRETEEARHYQRHYRRTRVLLCEGDIFQQEKSIICHTTSVSMGGCSLELKRSIHYHLDQVTLLFPNLDNTKPVQAQIRWAGPTMRSPNKLKTLGLAFVDIDHQHLTELLQKLQSGS